MVRRRAKQQNKTLFALIAGILLVLAIIFLLPSYTSSEDEAQNVAQTTLAQEGMLAPDFTVELFDGEQVTLSALKGKVVLVTFWATWCPPCREELKHVQHEIIDRFKGRDFCFLPISRGEKRATVEAFRQKNGYTFPMGLDPQQTIYNRYATNYIPRNFLIDASGKVVMTTIGFDREEFDRLIQTIEQNLNK